MGLAREKCSELTKICFQSWGDSHCQNAHGIYRLLPHPRAPATKVTQIHLSLARWYSRGARWVSVTSLLLARLTRLMQTLPCLCHYFQMSFDLFIKMSSDKDSTPSLSTAVCHQTPSRTPSVSQWLTDISLTATEAYWYSPSPRNVRKDYSPFLWSSVSRVVENLHYLL